MDSEEYEHIRATRVKELEDMVQKLEKENKQLLHRVRAPGARPQQGPAHTAPEGDLEDDLLHLSDVEEGGTEDEWLFTSPAHPPTPTQKILTPVQWLSADHTTSREGEIPSLDDVRLALSFPMSEAESLSTPPRHRPPRALGADSSSPRARQPTNKTARKYLDQVKMRRNSPPGMAPGTQLEEQPLEPREGGSEGGTPAEEAPVVSWQARQVVGPSASEWEVQNVPSSGEDARWRAKNVPSSSDDVPVIKWKAQNIPPSSDDVPTVKWKARNVPPSSDDVPTVKWKARNVPPSSDDVPTVNWKARNVPSSSDDVPTVNWKARNVPSSSDDVPTVKWKARNVPPSSDDVPTGKWKVKNVSSSAADVPVVKWKPEVTPSDEEEVPRVKWNPAKQPANDVPVVQWKAQQPTTPQRGQDAVPVVKWRAQAPTSPTSLARHNPAPRKSKNMPVKAVITQGRLQREQNESSEDAFSEESYGEGGRMVNGGDSDSQLSAEDHLNVSYEESRPSRYTSHYQQSPDSRHRSPAGGLPHPVVAVSPRGSPNLRSRSPSPSVQYLATVRSRSPSPSVRYGDHSTSPLLRYSPQSARRQILPPKAVRTPRSPSPVSRMAQQPQAKVPSPSGSPLVPRKMQSPNSSLPITPTSVKAKPAVRHTSPGRPPSGLPPTGTRPRQSGLKTPQSAGSSPASANPPSSRLQPRATGLTPPAGTKTQGQPRRVLPSPPTSGLRTPGRTKGSPRKSLPPRAKPPSAQGVDDDSSWLEGCF